MYFKLALNNVKKSFKDYTIYFLTLTFSVCIFYVFNAMESQKAMMIVSDTTEMMIKNLSTLIGYLSIFIAVVLGFLILYANKFLVRRRNKELGLYMLLGFEKVKISCILVLETFMIGLCSLVVGLGLGIFLSQGLSVFTAKLFGAQMAQFTFVFSKEGLYKSLGCFILIYAIVVFFNIGMISKCKLIDLLYADKKSEVPKVKSLWLSVILFVISVSCLAMAYVLIIDNGLMELDLYFYSAFVFAFIGTFLFFMSLSGFLLKMMQCYEKLYYREMNMFIFRQINSKINTTYVSMTLICLMLAVTIVTLSSGMAMNESMRSELEKLTPYDASLIWQRNVRTPEVRHIDIEAVLGTMDLNIEDYAKDAATYNMYETNIPYETFYTGQDLGKQSLYIKNIAQNKIHAIGLSDYNEALRLQGLKPITLKEGEYMLNCIYGELITILKTYLKQENTLTYEGKDYKATGLLENTLYLQLTAEADIIMVLPDEAVNTSEKTMTGINFNYKSADMEAKLIADVEAKTEGEPQVEGIEIAGLTRKLVYDASVGLSATMTYLTVYVSIVFLLASAAILALQQLTESEDNKVRYKLLRKLGVDEKVIHRALFVQIAIYFMVPLFLAIIHGVVGIYVANTVIMMVGEVNVLGSIIFTAVVFVLIYGVYFVGTYLSSKNLIRNK